MKTKLNDFVSEKITSYDNFEGKEVELTDDPKDYYFCIYDVTDDDDLDDIYSHKEHFMRSKGVIIVPIDYWDTYKELYNEDYPNELMHKLHNIKLIEIDDSIFEDWQERSPEVIFELMLNLGFEYSDELQEFYDYDVK
jgi:hypothetical protein